MQKIHKNDNFFCDKIFFFGVFFFKSSNFFQKKSKKKMEEKLIDLTRVEDRSYDGYMDLVKEFQMPSLVSEKKIGFVGALDHCVFCAKNYNKREHGDIVLNEHCKDIWSQINKPDFLKIISQCVTNLLAPCPSEYMFMKSKLVFNFIKQLAD